MPKRKALLVAINDYQGATNDLPSCLNDLFRMESELNTAYRGMEIRKLTDSGATVAAVTKGLDWLIDGASADDTLLFFYSGHGSQIAKNGVLEEYLVLYDNYFQDNLLSSRTQSLPGGVLTVVLDSCFSGGMEKRIYDLALGGRAAAKWYIPERIEFDKAFDQQNSITEFRPFGGAPVSTTWPPTTFHKGRVAKAASDEVGQLQLNGLLVSASSEDETAAASSQNTGGLSAFTWAFVQALAQDRAASVNSVVARADAILKGGGFRQTPLVKEPAGGGLAAKAFLSKQGASVAPLPFSLSPDVWAQVIGNFLSPWFGFGKGASVMNESEAQQLAATISNLAEGLNKFFSFSGGVSTPVGGVGVQGTFSPWPSKGIDLGDIIRVLPQVLQLLQGQKSILPTPCVPGQWPWAQPGFPPIFAAQPQKLFGIDDAILIPALASIITTAINAATKQAAPPMPAQVDEKFWGILIPAVAQLAGTIINAATKQAGPVAPAAVDEKFWGILIPAVAQLAGTIINAATKQGMPPAEAQKFLGGILSSVFSGGFPGLPGIPGLGMLGGLFR